MSDKLRTRALVANLQSIVEEHESLKHSHVFFEDLCKCTERDKYLNADWFDADVIAAVEKANSAFEYIRLWVDNLNDGVKLMQESQKQKES
jgi:hypothetical protein